MYTLLDEYELKLAKVFELTQKYLNNKELRDNLRKLLELTSKILTDKWKTGRKVVRTKFALEAFPDYPGEFMPLSLYTDAIVNLFDDILDELMEKDERALHVVEIAKVLTALFMDETFDRDIMNLYSEYFSKILCVAVSEMHYSKKMKNAEKVEELLHYAISCYNYRAYDVDIFFEIPMLALYGKIDGRIMDLARIFRAVNLIVKDWNDLEHDLKNETLTPAVIIVTKHPEKAKNCIMDMLEHYHSKINRILERINSDDSMYLPALKIGEMVNAEIEKFKGSHYSELR